MSRRFCAQCEPQFVSDHRRKRRDCVIETVASRCTIAFHAGRQGGEAKEKKPAIIFLSVVASYLRRGCNGRNVRRLANIIDRIAGRGRKKVFHSWKRVEESSSPLPLLSTRLHSATNVLLPSSPPDRRITFRSSFASFLGGLLLRSSSA